MNEPAPIVLPQLSGEGVWVTYYSDFSAVCVHPSEIAALRSIPGTGQEIIWLPWGKSLQEAVHEEWKKANERT